MQRDSGSVLFTEENVNEKVLKRGKKFTYAKDNEFVKLFNNIDHKSFKENEKIPFKTSFVKEMMK